MTARAETKRDTRIQPPAPLRGGGLLNELPLSTTIPNIGEQSNELFAIEIIRTLFPIFEQEGTLPSQRDYIVRLAIGLPGRIDVSQGVAEALSNAKLLTDSHQTVEGIHAKGRHNVRLAGNETPKNQPLVLAIKPNIDGSTARLRWSLSRRSCLPPNELMLDSFIDMRNALVREKQAAKQVERMQAGEEALDCAMDITDLAEILPILSRAVKHLFSGDPLLAKRMVFLIGAALDPFSPHLGSERVSNLIDIPKAP